MGSARLKGSKLSLKIDETEYKGDLTSYKISTEDKDSDVTTFEDVEKGNSAQFLLDLGLIQSTDPASLFMKIWGNEGKECEFILAPHGNEIATTTEPHLKGKLILPRPPEFGGEAGTAAFTTEAQCKLLGKPEVVTE
ncbi:hypothetical protein [Trueperella pyogenes]